MAEVDLRKEVIRIREELRTRSKCFRFQMDGGHIYKEDFIAMIECLPKDSVIYHIGRNAQYMSVDIYVGSVEFPITNPGEKCPQADVRCTRDSDYGTITCKIL